jgi:hypothetical protein
MILLLFQDHDVRGENEGERKTKGSGTQEGTGQLTVKGRTTTPAENQNGKSEIKFDRFI